MQRILNAAAGSCQLRLTVDKRARSLGGRPTDARPSIIIYAQKSPLSLLLQKGSQSRTNNSDSQKERFPKETHYQEDHAPEL